MHPLSLINHTHIFYQCVQLDFPLSLSTILLNALLIFTENLSVGCILFKIPLINIAFECLMETSPLPMKGCQILAYAFEQEGDL